ncbi:MAG: hypothetical protein K2J39_08125 [Ruminococcus sp.]|nr:hypothetical protein [Ruminococcus sp.]
MKNHRLPDNDEWNKIVDEAFSSDEIHTFSEKYNLKKYHNFQVRKGITMKRNNLLMNLTVIATALAVVAVPTGVYIAGNMTATKSATQYANEELVKNEQATPVSNDTIYAVEYDWLPEDFNDNSEDSYTYFTDADNKKIFMIASFTKNLSGEKIENGKALTVRDEYQIGDKTVDIRYSDSYVENSTDKDCTNYGRVATIYFNNTPYELELLVTDDVTKDDFKKIIENVKLIESDTERAEIFTGEQAGEDIQEISHETETLYDVEYGWIPDNLERIDGEPYCHEFRNVNSDRKTISVYFNKNLTGEESEMDTALTSLETYKTEDTTITVGYYDNYIENSTDTQHNKVGRQASVRFKDSPYHLVVWVTDDVTKDDFKKFLENIKFVPTDAEKAWVFYPEDLTQSEFTISDGNDDKQVNESTKTVTETQSKPAENYDDTIYDVEYGWLPEGLEYQQGNEYDGKFHDFIHNTGMTPAFVKNVSGGETPHESNFTVIDEYQTDDKTIEIAYRSNYEENTDNYNFGRIGTAYFKDTPYELSLWVTDNVTKEDFKKILENVKLVPSDTETASIYSGVQKKEPVQFESSSYEQNGIKVDESQIIQIGEELGEQFPDLVGNISTKIKSVSFSDNFNGLTTDGVGREADFSQYLNEDGKLIENVREFYTTKNGKEETIYFDDTTVSVMTVTITYTNNGDKPTADGGYCVFPTLQTIHDGYFYNPHFYNIMETEAMLEETITDYKENYQKIADCAGFSFSSPNQERRNEIHLDAGESAEVTLAFIVEDKFRDNLYLRLNDNGFVDLSNLK